MAMHLNHNKKETLGHYQKVVAVSATISSAHFRNSFEILFHSVGIFALSYLY